VRQTTAITVGGSPTTLLNDRTSASNNDANAITYSATPYSPSFTWTTSDENATIAVSINSGGGGGTTYKLFSGYIERFTSQWGGGGFLGNRQIDAVDALGVLQNTLQPVSTASAYTGTRFPLTDTAYSSANQLTGGITLAPNYPVTTLGNASMTPGRSGGLLGQTCLTTTGAGDLFLTWTSGSALYTFGAWIKTNGTTQQAVFAGTTTSSSNSMGVLINTNGTLSIFMAPSGAILATSTKPVNDGGWHQVYLVWNGTTGLTLYVDRAFAGATAGYVVSGSGTNSFALASDGFFGGSGIGAFTGSFQFADAQTTQYTAAQILDNYLSIAGWAGEPTFYNSSNPTYSKGRAKRWLDGAGWVGYGVNLDDQAAALLAGLVRLVQAGENPLRGRLLLRRQAHLCLQGLEWLHGM
jgi:hypothetical protein